MSTANLFGNLGSADTSAPAAEDAPKTTATPVAGGPAPATTTPAATQEEPAKAAPDTDVVDDELPDDDEPTELELLRDRAKFMGLKFKKTDDVEALKTMINEKLDAPVAETTERPKATASVETADEPSKLPVAKPTSLRKELQRENLRLVRVRITNLDPKDDDLSAQLFTVDNEYLGTVSRVIPFGEATDNGTHIEYCLYKLLKGMKFLRIKTVGKGINAKTEQAWVSKFAIEILDPLTSEELDALKASQLGRGTNFSD